MDIRTDREGTALVLIPSGRLDYRVADEVRAAFDAVIDGNDMRIVIDMATVTYMGRAALRALVETTEEAAERNARVVLCGLRPQFSEMLRAVGLDSVVQVRAARAEAVAAAESDDATEGPDATEEPAADAEGLAAERESSAGVAGGDEPHAEGAAVEERPAAETAGKAEGSTAAADG